MNRDALVGLGWSQELIAALERVEIELQQSLAFAAQPQETEASASAEVSDTAFYGSSELLLSPIR